MSGGGEVIVIGAGPAGTQCALTLHRFGVGVLVIERGAVPVEARPGWRSGCSIAVGIATENRRQMKELGVPILQGQAGEIVWAPLARRYSVATESAIRFTGTLVLAYGANETQGGCFMRRLPDLSGLELEADGFGFPVTGNGFETSCPGLYAIGDLASGYDRSVSTAIGSAASAARAIAARVLEERKAA